MGSHSPVSEAWRLSLLTIRGELCAQPYSAHQLTDLLDPPVDHPDNPTGPVWMRLDRRPVQPEQARSDWSRPSRPPANTASHRQRLAQPERKPRAQAPEASSMNDLEGFLCVSSMKVEGSSSHGRLLVAGRGGAADQRGGRVDQSSIRAGRPWCRAAGAAQSSRRPLHCKAMTHTERARTTPPANV
jgi:hypothetical protein